MMSFTVCMYSGVETLWRHSFIQALCVVEKFTFGISSRPSARSRSSSRRIFSTLHVPFTASSG